MKRLRVSWMGPKAQAIMGAFAKVVGDLSYDWMLRANIEHMPELASPTSVGLTASERQIDAGPTETTAALATRTTQAAILWRYAGTPLGLLMALHFAGFDGAVVVQQNGLAFQLQLPLPPIPVIAGQAWTPQTSLITTPCSQLAVALTSSVTPPSSSSAGRSIPAGTSWWEFDSNTDFCSRFAVLFPSLPASFTNFSNTGRASYTASDTATLTWSTPMAAGNPAAYYVMTGPAVVTDGGGPVSVTADASTETTAGVTMRASAPFTGYVDAASFGVTALDLQRLQTAISKWKPRKATCVGIYGVVVGKFFGWPVQAQSANTMGPATIAFYPGA